MSSLRKFDRDFDRIKERFERVKLYNNWMSAYLKAGFFAMELFLCLIKVTCIRGTVCCVLLMVSPSGQNH